MEVIEREISKVIYKAIEYYCVSCVTLFKKYKNTVSDIKLINYKHLF